MDNYKMTPVTSKRDKKISILPILLVLSILLLLTHDIILTNILAYQICKAGPNPKSFVKHTVEYPESIYWEDNIYPGFNEKDRLMMIRRYLDGVHLRTMALNAPDGTIYLYTATEKDWRVSREIKARKRKGNYLDTLDTEERSIAVRGETYTQQTMPQLKYEVIFNPVQLTAFQRRYLYSDEVTR